MYIQYWVEWSVLQFIIEICDAFSIIVTYLKYASLWKTLNKDCRIYEFCRKVSKKIYIEQYLKNNYTLFRTLLIIYDKVNRRQRQSNYMAKNKKL